MITEKQFEAQIKDLARWLWELRKVPGIEVYIWRPRHFEPDGGRIAEILR